MSEQIIDFEEAKDRAIKHISEMTEGMEGVLYLHDGAGYLTIRIGMSDATKVKIISHEGRDMLRAWQVNEE